MHGQQVMVDIMRHQRQAAFNEGREACGCSSHACNTASEDRCRSECNKRRPAGPAGPAVPFASVTQVCLIGINLFDGGCSLMISPPTYRDVDAMHYCIISLHVPPRSMPCTFKGFEAMPDRSHHSPPGLDCCSHWSWADTCISPLYRRVVCGTLHQQGSLASNNRSITLPQVQVGQSSNDSHQVATAATATVNAPTTVSAPPPPSGAEKPANDVFAGAMARAASQSTIHPLDTMKVRMQAGKPGPGMR